MKIRAFERELKIMPIIVEAVASIVTGFLVLFWGWVWLSNELYQFDVFTRIRNELLPEKRIMQRFDKFLFIDLDPDSYLILRDLPDVEDPELWMAAETLQVVSETARRYPDRRFVLGFDIAFFGSEKGSISKVRAGAGTASDTGPTAGRGPEVKEVEADIKVLLTRLGNIPENLYVVLGSRIVNNGPDTYAFPRSDYLMQEIYLYGRAQQELVKKGGSADRPEKVKSIMKVKNLLGNRIFLGAMNYITGTIRSSGRDRNEIKAAVGYYPSFVGESSSAGGYLPALPFLMYLLGEGDSKLLQQNLSLGEHGFVTTEFPDIHNFSGLRYYDFHTSRDVTELPIYRRLRDYSPKIAQLVSGLRSPESEQGEAPAIVPRRGGGNETTYIFSGYSTMAAAVLGGDFEDVIVPAGAVRNPMTGEVLPVSGIIAHMTALENLLNREKISRIGLPVQIITAVIIAFFVFLFAWRTSLIKSIIGLLGGSAVLFLFGFLLFYPLRLFFPLKIPFISLIITWVGVVIFRFIYSLNLADFYSRLSGRFFNAEKLSGTTATEWYKPRLVPKGFVLLLQPGQLPDIESLSTENAEGYAEIIGDLTQTVFDIIEKHGGGHDNLGSGIIGIWGVFGETEAKEKPILKTASECFAALPEMRAGVERKFPGYGAGITFDIYIHYCSFYFGAVRTGGSQNIIIGGNEIIEAQKKMQMAGRDRKNSLTLSSAFVTKASQEEPQFSAGNRWLGIDESVIITVEDEDG
jgi:hypothetical protein